MHDVDLSLSLYYVHIFSGQKKDSVKATFIHAFHFNEELINKNFVDYLLMLQMYSIW